MNNRASQMRAESKVYAVNDAVVKAIWQYLGKRRSTMRLKHFFACLLAVALLCGCTPRTAEVQTPPVQSPPEPEQAEPTYSPQPPAPPAHATLLAVGDNLIHDVIYWQAKTDDGYDFFPAYQAVAL